MGARRIKPEQVIFSKTCTRCGTEKCLSEFKRSWRHSTGYFSRCMACESARLSAYRRSQAGKAAAKLYRERRREEIRVYALAWHRRHPDAQAKYSKDYYERLGEKALVRSRAKTTKRRALKRGASSAVTFTREYIMERDNYRCHICGKRVKPGDAHLDHLIPLSAGGPHTPENVRLAHSFCNLSRHTGRLPAQLLLLG